MRLTRICACGVFCGCVCDVRQSHGDFLEEIGLMCVSPLHRGLYACASDGMFECPSFSFLRDSMVSPGFDPKCTRSLAYAACACPTTQQSHRELGC